MSGFHNLSNGEIVFIYLSNLKTLRSVDGMIEKKEIESSVPFLGTEISFRLSLDEEHIDKIVTHGYYQNLLSVSKKLKPIVDLIKETEPELYYEIKDHLDINISDII